MACTECQKLKEDYDAALDRLRKSTASRDLDKAELDRVAFDHARLALETHLKQDRHD